MYIYIYIVIAPSKAGGPLNRGKSFHSASSSVDSDTITNAETVLSNTESASGLGGHKSRRKSFWNSVQAGNKKSGSGLVGDISDMKSTVSSNNSGADDVENGGVM